MCSTFIKCLNFDFKKLKQYILIYINLHLNSTWITNTIVFNSMQYSETLKLQSQFGTIMKDHFIKF